MQNEASNKKIKTATTTTTVTSEKVLKKVQGGVKKKE